MPAGETFCMFPLSCVGEKYHAGDLKPSETAVAMHGMTCAAFALDVHCVKGNL